MNASTHITEDQPDVVLIGAGIMNAALAVLLKEFAARSEDCDSAPKDSWLLNQGLVGEESLIISSPRNRAMAPVAHEPRVVVEARPLV